MNLSDCRVKTESLSAQSQAVYTAYKIVAIVVKTDAQRNRYYMLCCLQYTILVFFFDEAHAGMFNPFSGYFLSTRRKSLAHKSPHIKSIN